MNTGTKIRTALRIAVSLNTAIYAVTNAVGALNNDKLNAIWMIFTIISDFIVSALTTYYNNDYTEIASIKTGEMRQAKQESSPDYVGEEFFEGDEDDAEESI